MNKAIGLAAVTTAAVATVANYFYSEEGQTILSPIAKLGLTALGMLKDTVKDNFPEDGKVFVFFATCALTLGIGFLANRIYNSGNINNRLNRNIKSESQSVKSATTLAELQANLELHPIAKRAEDNAKARNEALKAAFECPLDLSKEELDKWIKDKGEGTIKKQLSSAFFVGDYPGFLLSISDPSYKEIQNAMRVLQSLSPDLPSENYCEYIVTLRTFGIDYRLSQLTYHNNIIPLVYEYALAQFQKYPTLENFKTSVLPLMREAQLCSLQDSQTIAGGKDPYINWTVDYIYKFYLLQVAKLAAPTLVTELLTYESMTPNSELSEGVRRFISSTLFTRLDFQANRLKFNEKNEHRQPIRNEDEIAAIRKKCAEDIRRQLKVEIDEVKEKTEEINPQMKSDALDTFATLE